MALESLIQQTYSNIEIIVMDNASTDNTREVVKEYQKEDDRIVLISNEENVGLYDSRIIGMEKANGEYIAFCDADDFYNLDGIEKLYKVAIGHSQSDIITSNNHFFSISEDIVYKKNVHLM